MANLAIEGHPDRGKEVIEILEMLGGKNIHRIDAIRDYYVYFVMDDKNKTISSLKLNQVLPEQFIIYSFEEFLEKFPYKIGDKVVYKTYGIHSKIKSMLWNKEKEQVFYRLESNELFVATSDELKPLKEETIKESINKTNKVIFDTQAQSCDIMNAIIKETMEENKSPKTQAEVDKYLQEHPVKNAMNVIDIENCLETDGLKLPENVVINSKGIGSIQFIQWYEKQQYPKTYEECCEYLGLSHCGLTIDLPFNYSSLFISLAQLYISRNAYWKIAGEQMGLGKAWEPDWKDASYKYFICYIKDEIWISNTRDCNRFLGFPTKEMRDTFYENFKELINQCKELL